MDSGVGARSRPYGGCCGQFLVGVSEAFNGNPASVLHGMQHSHDTSKIHVTGSGNAPIVFTGVNVFQVPADGMEGLLLGLFLRC
jgi:hypothetical protein